MTQASLADSETLAESVATRVTMTLEIALEALRTRTEWASRRSAASALRTSARTTALVAAEISDPVLRARFVEMAEAWDRSGRTLVRAVLL